MLLSEIKRKCLQNYANFSDNDALSDNDVRSEKGTANIDTKYHIASNNFWNAFNNFLARLQQLDKLHLNIATYSINSDDNDIGSYIKELDFTKDTILLYSGNSDKHIKIGKIYGAKLVSQYGEIPLNIIKKPNTTNSVLVKSNVPYRDGQIIEIQFKSILPVFSQQDIVLEKDIVDDTKYTIDRNIDMELYGVDDYVLDIGISNYIPAILNKDTDRDRYNNDMNFAEAQLNNIDAYSGDTLFPKFVKLHKFGGYFR